eukprot:TRINITY_DN12303_c0_g2_i1.p3 TRINITY_DN12303_c0_g2~~TRINITY_DN12303_c0_g2_i1.p3  ORF type:complete len:242 (-),score=10.54 TRINITY_DN12303_c0_g2_i1:406-1131(-)
MIGSSNILGFIITFLGAITTVKGVDHIAHFVGLEAKTARKIMHIVTGVIYASTWLVYEGGIGARIMCAAVPLMSVVYFAMVGAGIINDQKLIKGATRHGKREELLEGPIYYGLVNGLMCLIFWRTSLDGILAIAVMCGGDGIADVVGRQYGYILGPLPWNSRKTYIGSLACFIGGLVTSLLGSWMFWSAGFLLIQFQEVFIRCLIVSFVGSCVESLPDIEDNLSVPLSVVVTLQLLKNWQR